MQNSWKTHDSDRHSIPERYGTHDRCKTLDKHKRPLRGRSPLKSITPGKSMALPRRRILTVYRYKTPPKIRDFLQSHWDNRSTVTYRTHDRTRSRSPAVLHRRSLDEELTEMGVSQSKYDLFHEALITSHGVYSPITPDSEGPASTSMIQLEQDDELVRVAWAMQPPLGHDINHISWHQSYSLGCPRSQDLWPSCENSFVHENCSRIRLPMLQADWCFLREGKSLAEKRFRLVIPHQTHQYLLMVFWPQKSWLGHPLFTVALLML